MILRLLVLSVVVGSGAAARAEDRCVSGPQVGQRPGPYAFTVATGPQRGQSFCYICDTADKPAIICFARQPSDALGKLLAGCDAAVGQHKAAGLRSWATLLGEKHDLDALAAWAKQHGLRNVPVGTFDDPDGPPSYRLSRDAEVTVILFVKQKVVANFAFRAGELTGSATQEVVKATAALARP